MPIFARSRLLLLEPLSTCVIPVLAPTNLSANAVPVNSGPAALEWPKSIDRDLQIQVLDATALAQ
jgi:hypothetical protein